MSGDKEIRMNGEKAEYNMTSEHLKSIDGNKVYDNEINLREFIERFVCPNSLIRLWSKDPEGSGHIMLVEKDKDVCMEWQILKGECWQARYESNIVIGVTDIFIDGPYREAINIVIDLHRGVMKLDKNDFM